MEIWNPGRVKQAKEETVLGEHPGEGQVWRSGVKARERQTAATAKNHCSLIITAPDPQTIIQVSLSSIINTLGGNMVWWPMPVTLAHGSLRQKDHQSEASLSYKRPRPGHRVRPCVKNKQTSKQNRTNSKVRGWGCKASTDTGSQTGPGEQEPGSPVLYVQKVQFHVVRSQQRQAGRLALSTESTGVIPDSI